MKKFAEKLFLVPVVYADDFVGGPVNLEASGEFNALGGITVGGIIPAVIRIVLIVAALVALLFLIIGGIKWITSGGDKAQVESARGTVTAALIGLLVVFAAWALIKLVEYLFGISVLSFNVPTFTGEA